jgi:hypothetical protein
MKPDQLIALSGERIAGLFALLDAARAPALPARLAEFEVEHASLFAGEMGKMLKDVAPYLARCPHDSPLMKWILEEGWGDSWGIFVSANLSLEELRRHLKRFLLVKDEEGRRYHFRFYDPRVLRVYLPTCTPREAAMFFGRIRQFLVEGDSAEELWIFEWQERKVVRRIVPLTEAGQSNRWSRW